MGKRSAAIHCNLKLNHQVRYAKALQRGITDCDAKIVGADYPADIHIIIGNWFAPHWIKDGTLMLDRAYWGDPNYVSVHWLVHGEKLFTMHNPDRSHPELKPMKNGDRKIYLCDYGDKGISGMTVRHHPAQMKPKETLKEALDRHEIAVGRRTTALVDAAILGLRVITEDPFSPVYRLSQGFSREDWIRDLAWHNWSLEEIERGEMWNVFGSNH